MIKQSQLHPLLIKATEIKDKILKLPCMDNSDDIVELLITTKGLTVELRIEIDKELKKLRKS